MITDFTTEQEIEHPLPPPCTIPLIGDYSLTEIEELLRCSSTLSSSTSPTSQSSQLDSNVSLSTFGSDKKN
jgi:hypothetical protein